MEKGNPSCYETAHKDHRPLPAVIIIIEMIIEVGCGNAEANAYCNQSAPTHVTENFILVLCCMHHLTQIETQVGEGQPWKKRESDLEAAKPKQSATKPLTNKPEKLKNTMPAKPKNDY